MSLRRVYAVFRFVRISVIVYIYLELRFGLADSAFPRAESVSHPVAYYIVYYYLYRVSRTISPNYQRHLDFSVSREAE